MRKLYLTCALVFVCFAPILAVSKHTPPAWATAPTPDFGIMPVATVQAVLASYGKATPTPTATYTPTPTPTATVSAPTVVSATVQSDGRTIVVVFSVAVTSTSWTAICSQFQSNVNSTGYNAFSALPCYVSGDNTTTITLDTNAFCIAESGDSFKIKYTRLLGATDVKATSGGAFLANFTDFTCVNNSGGCG